MNNEHNLPEGHYTDEELNKAHARQTTKDINAMVWLTCVVYKRPECYDCILRRVVEKAKDKFGDRMAGGIAANDAMDCVRDIIVFVKESAEKELGEACTAEPLLRVMPPDMVVMNKLGAYCSGF